MEDQIKLLTLEHEWKLMKGSLEARLLGRWPQSHLPQSGKAGSQEGKLNAKWWEAGTTDCGNTAYCLYTVSLAAPNLARDQEHLEEETGGIEGAAEPQNEKMSQQGHG